VQTTNLREGQADVIRGLAEANIAARHGGKCGVHRIASRATSSMTARRAVWHSQSTGRGDGPSDERSCIVAGQTGCAARDLTPNLRFARRVEASSRSLAITDTCDRDNRVITNDSTSFSIRRVETPSR
jgi:hypothetical protein